MADSPQTKEKLLISVRNDIQAALVENLLKEHGIACVKRHRSVGAVTSVYTGMSNLGLDIYVEESLWEQAKEIVLVMESEMSECELEEQALAFEESDDESDMNSSKSDQTSTSRVPFRRNKLIWAIVIALSLILLLLLTMEG